MCGALHTKHLVPHSIAHHYTLGAVVESVATTGRLQRLQNGIQRESADLLARREFLERGEELPDVLLRRHEQEDVIDPPAVPVHAFVVADLERIGAQVEELREAQRHERLLPDVAAVRALLGEDDLPLVVAQRRRAEPSSLK